MKAVGIGPAVKYAGAAESRQYTKPPGEVIAQVIRLPRKPAKLQAVKTRTADRHR